MIRSPRFQHLVMAISALSAGLLPASAMAQSFLEQRVTVEIGVIPLLLGIGIILAALIIEWNGIIKLLTIENKSLYAIESTHPRLPKKREIIIVILLSLALTIFLTQIVLRVYNPPKSIFEDIPFSLKE